MTLTQIAIAWAAVSLWFLLAGNLVAGALARTEPTQVDPSQRVTETPRQHVLAASATVGEALVLTLFAALWFASLGSGGWWLLFLLLGLLVGFAARLQAIIALRVPRRYFTALAFTDTARYVVAGGLLAWRLG